MADEKTEDVDDGKKIKLSKSDEAAQAAAAVAQRDALNGAANTVKDRGVVTNEGNHPRGRI